MNDFGRKLSEARAVIGAIIEASADYLRWPLVTRGRFAAVRLENYTLRDCLRAANDELRRHRLLIGGLKAGVREMEEAVFRAVGDAGGGSNHAPLHSRAAPILKPK
jgi:hypothetical protein